jgi:hypothetical protein
VIYVEALLALLVGGAALAVILLPLLRPEAPAPAPAWELPELEETRKGQALLALREIEFDLATGKLSVEDHAELKERFTVEAAAALREEGGATVATKPAPSPAATPKGGAVRCPTCGPRPESDARFCSNCGRGVGDATCGGCGAPLARGAKFCEGCGRPRAA